MDFSVVEEIRTIIIQKTLKQIVEPTGTTQFWEICFPEWLAERLQIDTTFRFYINELEGNKLSILPPTYGNSTYYELLVYFQDPPTALIFYYLLGVLSGELIFDSLNDYFKELITGEITPETWLLITEALVIFCRDSVFGTEITLDVE
jgi:hypothetical protein